MYKSMIFLWILIGSLLKVDLVLTLKLDQLLDVNASILQCLRTPPIYMVTTAHRWVQFPVALPLVLPLPPRRGGSFSLSCGTGGHVDSCCQQGRAPRRSKINKIWMGVHIGLLNNDQTLVSFSNWNWSAHNLVLWEIPGFTFPACLHFFFKCPTCSS